MQDRLNIMPNIYTILIIAEAWVTFQIVLHIE